MLEILKPNFELNDERGSLIQLVREGFSQVNVISSKKGYQRGGHYHKLNREAFYIIEGKINLILEQDQQTCTYSFKKGDMFLILPNVQHDFDFLDDTVLVSLYDRGVELPDGSKDIYK